VKISVVGSDETKLIGTTTGDLHELGTATVAGTKTNELNGTATTALEGTD